AGINQRVLEQRWIVDWNGAFVVGDVEIREPLDAQDQLMVCLWVIRIPILVVTRDAAVVDQPGKYELVRVVLRLDDPLDIVITPDKIQFLLGKQQTAGDEAHGKNSGREAFHHTSCAFAGVPLYKL